MRQDRPQSKPEEAPRDETQFQVLRTLEANPLTSQRELALALGMSVGKANYCLRALIDRGLIKVRTFRGSRNKLVYAYLLTPKGVSSKATLTARFLRSKIAEYEALRREIGDLKRDLDARRR